MLETRSGSNQDSSSQATLEAISSLLVAQVTQQERGRATSNASGLPDHTDYFGGHAASAAHGMASNSTGVSPGQNASSLLRADHSRMSAPAKSPERERFNSSFSYPRSPALQPAHPRSYSMSAAFGSGAPHLGHVPQGTAAPQLPSHPFGIRTMKAAKKSQPDPMQVAWNKQMTSAQCATDILDLISRHGHEFNAVNLATALHRLASQFRYECKRHQRTIQIVLDQCQRTSLDGFTARELANLVWAMAKADMPDKCPIFEMVAQRAMRTGLQGFTPQAMANLLWGMSKSGLPHEELFRLISEVACLQQLQGFNAQNLSNTLWAMATANMRDATLFRMVGDVIVSKRLDGFSPQNIANTIWAMAKVSLAHPALFELVSKKFGTPRHDGMSPLAGFKPQEIANLVWGMATCRLADPSLLQTVCYHCSATGLHEWKPQELANMLWAMASAGYCSEDLLETFAREAITRNLAGWKPQEVSSVIWAFAKLGYGHRELLALVSAFAKKSGVCDWKPQELANLVWALAKYDMLDDNLFAMVATRAATMAVDLPAAALPSKDDPPFPSSVSTEIEEKEHSIEFDIAAVTRLLENS